MSSVARRAFSFFLISAVALCGGIDHGENLALAQTSASNASPSRSSIAPAGAESADKNAFRTKYAYFEPAIFDDLPGWRDDKLGDVWAAFRQSCAALQKRDAWERPCGRVTRIDGADDEALRQFFEQEFNLYQIHDTDQKPAGEITGYYEPLLTGNRRYGAPYVYPVYEVPDDMLYLDARKLPIDLDGEIRVHVEGRNVIPSLAAGATGPGPYKLDIAGVQPDIRSRKYRLRIDGDRVVPYFSRQQIELGQMSRARVIVWVDNPAALYSMQIQGSGKVRLPDGEIVRVAYGEQNGHPFRPSLLALPQQINAKGKRQVVATRGLAPASLQEEDAAAGTPEEPPSGPTEIAATAQTRGLNRPPPQFGASEVERMIEALMPASARQAARPPETPSRITPASPPSPRTKAKAPAAGADAQDQRIADQYSGAMPVPAPAAAIPNSDPSYVFFRRIPDSDHGPIGALGVPLTAGRSVAVDPRTTPLGFPVFVSTSQPGRKEALNRLMMAQDTGGAIRGAVRADYFWGFGAKAFVQASRMKEDGRMWLLLPKNQKIAANSGGTLLRGIGGQGREAQPAECVVPDPDLCVE